MHVIVLGSGVIGVSTAYFLAKAGHQVTVIDRQAGPALETSFANAGEISPGYSAPWAAPGLAWKVVKWLLMRNSPLVLTPSLDPALWRFGFSTLANCTQAKYDLNKSRMVRLAEYSRDRLIDLRRDTGIRYDERTLGTLQLFRYQSQLDGIGGDTAILDRFNVPYRVLDRAGCIVQEPSLARVADKFVGGLLLPGDETGDCFAFTNALAAMAKAEGVRFQTETTITGLMTDGARVTAAQTSAGAIQGDRFVLALGSYSPLIARPLGLSLPVYPVKGYSLTIPIRDAAAAPESTVMDETHKVAVTRLGDRIRVGGTAGLSGYDLSLKESRRKTLVHVVSDLFPGSCDPKEALFWTGLRPMTPDGTPILGPTRYDNLFLNTGHGTLGWTMAVGSARVVTAMVTGAKPEIDTNGLTLARYGRG